MTIIITIRANLECSGALDDVVLLYVILHTLHTQILHIQAFYQHQHLHETVTEQGNIYDQDYSGFLIWNEMNGVSGNNSAL